VVIKFILKHITFTFLSLITFILYHINFHLSIPIFKFFLLNFSQMPGRGVKGCPFTLSPPFANKVGQCQFQPFGVSRNISTEFHIRYTHRQDPDEVLQKCFDL
jgi:hypothetical protein